jgi:hydroxylaminobenzene mutase
LSINSLFESAGDRMLGPTRRENKDRVDHSPVGVGSKARTDKKTEPEMNSSDTLSLQGHRLLQIGVALFLFSSLEGFAVPHFAVPSLGRSVHTLSAFSGVILLTLGLLWPRLNLGAAASRIAFWLFIYSAFATLAGFVMAAVWGAGNSIIPLAAGTARGTDLQEVAINVVMYSAAPGVLISLALILWGLRIVPAQSAGGPAQT